MAYISATEAARRLGVSEKTVRRWIQENRLTAFHPNGYRNKLAIAEQDVEQKKRELEEYQQPAATEQGPAASEDIEKRIERVEHWLSDLQRWLSELESRIAAIDGEASPLPVQTQPEPTRTRTRKEETPASLPEGSMQYWQFAKLHKVNRVTFRDQIVKGMKKSGERVEAIRVDDKYWLSPEQQIKALEFWRRYNVSFSEQPEQEIDPLSQYLKETAR